MTTPGPIPDRERIAERLISASRKHSFDPDTELDWDQPLEPHMWFWPPELVSLYDTPLWQRMSLEQRIELSRHEWVSISSLGIRMEIILMQLLLRHIFDQPPTSAHTRYALTEIADECRHSLMFGRLLARCGLPAYEMRWPYRSLARLLKTFSPTPASFTAALVCEEIYDWMQRLTFPDERVQPLVRGVTRIHVIEEARHVRYAREELRRQMATCARWKAESARITAGSAACLLSSAMIHPDVYSHVGLDRREATAQAKASGHRRAVLRASAERLTDYLDDIGALAGPGRHLWVASGLLAK